MFFTFIRAVCVKMDTRYQYSEPFDNLSKLRAPFHVTEGMMAMPEPKSGHYRVIELADKDDIDATLDPWKQSIYDRKTCLSILSLSATSLYLFLRARHTAKAQNATPDTLCWAWLFLICEMMSFCKSLSTIKQTP